MNKKNNRSGFTLVELIVVMCLMGIIMGAVLNFIQPTAKLYKTTNTYLNEEEAVSTIANALEDDLMYATGVYVYATDDATKGPAEIKNIVTEILNDKSVDVTELSNCIVLDNETVRSTEVAIRKDSKGRILKYGWDGAEFMDVSASGMLAGEKLYNNVFALQDQTFMGDDKFVFSIKNDTGSQNSLNIKMDVYRPSYNGTNYEYNELTFSAVKAIEFVNLKAEVTTFDHSNISAAASVTDPKYIYIFYNRKPRVNANATRYPYECYVKDASNNYITEPVLSSEYFEGDDISENVMKNAESSNIESFIVGEYVYERTGKYATVPNIEDETNVNVVELTCMPAATTNPMRLYAVYKKTHITNMPALEVHFWKNKDKIGGSYLDAVGVTYYNMPVNPPDLGDAFVAAPPSLPEMHQGETLTYNRWADCATDQPVTDFEHITRNLDVYPQEYHYYAVTFLNQDGDVIPEDQLRDADGNELGNNIPVIEGGAVTLPDTAQSGLQDESGTYSWVNEDGTPFDATAGITAPTNVKLSFVPTPEATYSKTVNVNSYINNGKSYCQPQVDITSPEPLPIGSRFKVTFTFSHDIANYFEGGPWAQHAAYDASTLTISGKTLSYELYTTEDNITMFTTNFQITAQDSTVNLTVTPDSIEVVKLD